MNDRKKKYFKNGNYEIIAIRIQFLSLTKFMENFATFQNLSNAGYPSQRLEIQFEAADVEPYMTTYLQEKIRIKNEFSTRGFCIKLVYGMKVQFIHLPSRKGWKKVLRPVSYNSVKFKFKPSSFLNNAANLYTRILGGWLLFIAKRQYKN